MGPTVSHLSRVVYDRNTRTDSETRPLLRLDSRPYLGRTGTCLPTCPPFRQVMFKHKLSRSGHPSFFDDGADRLDFITIVLHCAAPDDVRQGFDLDQARSVYAGLVLISLGPPLFS
jgi:hypothetical protein